MPALLPLYATLNPDTYGGAVLLGVDGVCIISHGSTGATRCATPSAWPTRWSTHGMVDEIRATASHAT